MNTPRRIDYMNLRSTIRQLVHTHYDSSGVLVESERDPKLIASRRWVTNVHIPNLPMTMTFYGPTKIKSLLSAEFLLQYFIRGPSTPEAL